MKITLSYHAKQQARERGINISEIKRTIERGAKHFQGKKIVSDHMHIRVVYKIIGKEHFVITVMIRLE
ncbi:MAG: DUF4258 domain-containing protein [Candidatus Woesearchaeota archaeon]